MSRSWFFLGVAVVLNVTLACSPNGTSDNGSGAKAGSAGASGSPSGGAGMGGASAAAGTAGEGVGGFAAGPGSGGSNPTGGNVCNTDDNKDDDGDGYTEKDGDCNDCDKNVGPGSIEVLAVKDMNGNTPDPADEDCDGKVDNVPELCDDGLAIDDADAFHGANAIDLCQKTTAGEKPWGVLSANYTRANGMSVPGPLQYGIMSKFGDNVNPQGGKSMLALSTGYARDVDDPSPCGTKNCGASTLGTAPPNFPQQVCNASAKINDDVALDLKIKTPKNAIGYSFSFKFQSFEFAEWVCTPFNDQFIALVNPAPPGSINGNISFDSKNNPVSVNIGFFDVCDPKACDTWAQHCASGCPPKPMPCCPSGPTELVGTGFDSWASGEYAGGTSWLKTQAPVKGGSELNLRFTIWDAEDHNLDSTVLIDHFQWIANGGTVKIETTPDPEPK